MTLALWIVAGLGATVSAAAMAALVYDAIIRKRTPLEVRKRRVLAKIRHNETVTGATYVHRGLLSGITPEDARELAESAGYRYTGRDGHHLTFQRRLPGQE
ncbi:hypothetical protein ACFS2C_24710 [Prauserella oleivorans]|uniref:Uncharacterized protein n=1 Tax=Prauserella oleivorans TaxID=1478153 RepID=A0ABW5WGH5_9PSEU